MVDARSTALRLLIKLENNAGYSNIMLDNELSRVKLDERDRHFAAALFYGVLERRLTLDKIIEKYLVRKQDKLASDIRNILRLGIYQLKFMDSVPDHTAVDESVKLVKANKNPALKGFVNGILRGFIRDGKPVPKGSNRAEQMMYDYSCPIGLVEKYLAEYGEKAARAMLDSSLGAPPVTVRVNPMKGTEDAAAKALEQEGIKCRKNDIMPFCFEISGGNIEKTKAYKDGLVHVQDISSQLCCAAVDAKAGMTVIDVCAAPGGKSFTIAQDMENRGALYSFDLHESRVRLIKSGAERLGLDVINAKVNNAKVYNEELPPADRVLCDVPCSGLGVIRRKPEIKYKDLSEFERLPDIQAQILETSSRYVKTGGVLVYSTCTLSRAENDEVVDGFLSVHKEFSPEPLGICFGKLERVSITPDLYNSDGFFIAKFKRTE